MAENAMDNAVDNAVDNAMDNAAGPVNASAWIVQQATDYTSAEGDESMPTWDGNAPVYQWSDEFGDVGPKFPNLELELFGDPETRHERTGLDFAR